MVFQTLQPLTIFQHVVDASNVFLSDLCRATSLNMRYLDYVRQMQTLSSILCSTRLVHTFSLRGVVLELFVVSRCCWLLLKSLASFESRRNVYAGRLAFEMFWLLFICCTYTALSWRSSYLGILEGTCKEKEKE